ncbi:MAG: hypothetical protein ABUK01_04775 [Leptospirales bacterium]
MKKSIVMTIVLPVTALFLLTACCKKEEVVNTEPEMQKLTCVVKPDADGVCTEDINSCGVASVCQCPVDYEYSAETGKCIVFDIAMGEPGGTTVESECSTLPEGTCTKDINECGHPTSCECGDGAKYEARIGQCVRSAVP